MIGRLRRLARAAALLLLLLAVLPAVLAEGDEAARLFPLLGLRAGIQVADVGAGDGEWAERIAREVGSAGHVFATEVDEKEIGKIEERVRKGGLANVSAVLGTQRKTGLPDQCCDAVLLRMVYHHFTEPAPMRASLRAALRPAASLVVIDTEPQSGWPPLTGVPDRQGHGIAEEQLVREMTSDGFEVVSRHPDWTGSGDRYCVVFRRSPPGGTGERR